MIIMMMVLVKREWMWPNEVVPYFTALYIYIIPLAAAAWMGRAPDRLAKFMRDMLPSSLSSCFIQAIQPRDAAVIPPNHHHPVSSTLQ